jgi:hypothetical protein
VVRGRISRYAAPGVVPKPRLRSNQGGGGGNLDNSCLPGPTGNLVQPVGRTTWKANWGGERLRRESTAGFGVGLPVGPTLWAPAH